MRLLARVRLWQARRRHDRTYGNPRSAQPRPVNIDWRRRAYRAEVGRNILFAIGVSAAMVAVAAWLLG